jgi:hypothetical protein
VRFGAGWLWVGAAHFGAGFFGCEHPFDLARVALRCRSQAAISDTCLRGTINTYGAVKIAMRWTLSGLGRGNGEGCNLNITTPEMADVVEVAKRLGAGFTTTHSSSAPVRRIRTVTH